MGRRFFTRAALAATAGLLSCAGLWVGIHEIPWLGPFLADSARAVVGPSVVARVEDAVYGVEDVWKRVWLDDMEPEALWEVPEAAAAAPPLPMPVSSALDANPPSPAYPPKAVGRVHPGFGTDADGVWIPMPSLRWPDDAARLFKTQLHPDPKRPWTSVAVVAIDLRRIDLHLLAGVYVPEATTREGRTAKRPAIIPSDHQPALIAAFNGGFKTIHGHLGMYVEGVTLIPPQASACTIAKLPDGRIDIGTWETRFEHVQGLAWWRQTPTCLVENGEFGKGVLSDGNINWGASVHGSTFIRRSALGIDEGGRVLFMGIGDSVSARLIAVALKHAGAHAVAQLDVNWTLPRFLTYEPGKPGSDRLEPTPLYEGLQYVRDEYVRERSARDFFYVLRRDPGTG